MKSLRSVFIRFIWAKKHPHLSYQLLAMPKTQGGMAFPDLIQYYQAVHLARVLDWCRGGGQKAWVAIEQSCTQIPLQCVPWLRLGPLGTLRHHPLIGATLRVVQLSHLFSTTEGKITRLYPILGNPAFPPGHTDSCFKQTLRQGKFHLGDYLAKSKLKTRVETRSMFNLPLDPRRMQQLAHFLSSLLRGEWSDRSNTSLENLCLVEAPSAHRVSEIYKL